MITPRFSVKQDDEYVYVDIKISSVRFSGTELEMIADNNMFIFHVSPYYLRLRFPHEILDDERAKAEYQATNEAVVVRLPKAINGQYFEDLDVPTKLLSRHENKKESLPAAAARGPLIQEISEPAIEAKLEDHSNSNIESIRNAGEQFDWEIEQTPHNNSGSLIKSKYGFDYRYEALLNTTLENGNDINDVPDPDHTPSSDRVTQRLHQEDLKFDPDYYVSEYLTGKYGTDEDKEINGIHRLLKYTPSLVNLYLEWYSQAEDKQRVMPMQFSENEQAQMRDNIPHKSYDLQDLKRPYVTIMSLIFSYCFEQIENESTHNTESAWTIGKLTPQISALDQELFIPENSGIIEQEKKSGSMIRSALIAGIRRSLSYPLHRNYDLSIRAWKFAYYIMRAGKRLVTRVLLDIHEVFRYHDAYYIYNKILLDDLCSWLITNGNENVLRSLATSLKSELDEMSRDKIIFNCVAGIDEETGAISWEQMTLKEIEILAEAQYIELGQSSEK